MTRGMRYAVMAMVAVMMAVPAQAKNASALSVAQAVPATKENNATPIVIGIAALAAIVALIVSGSGSDEQPDSN